MGRTRHIAVVLLAACLGGCGYSMFDDATSSLGSSGKISWTKSGGSQTASAPDSAGAAAASTSDQASLNSLFARAADGNPGADPAPAPTPPKPVAVADASSAPVPAAPSPLLSPPAAEKVNVEPHGRAYLFRGVAGLIYSRGMDRLEERIQRAGIPASVDTYLMWRPVAEQAVRDYRRDPQPVIIIGHSMGGDSALDFAEMLNAANIPVSLLVTYDPTRIADDVPPNVERYINIFQSSNFMGGGNVVQGSHFHGHYASYNLKDHAEIVHINIEKTERIQEQLVAKVAQIASTPADAQGEAVPLHFEVPADAAIELWDSGLPVQAHAGDTLKTLAATYHVPAWALAQCNTVSERTVLAEGQRVVIPRHLAPNPGPVASAVSSYAPAGR